MWTARRFPCDDFSVSLDDSVDNAILNFAQGAITFCTHLILPVISETNF